MKRLLTLILCALSFAACKKDGNILPAQPKDFSDFLKNTEWVGVLDRNGYHYPPPCCLRFNPDNTITVYAPFWFNNNGVYVTPDSIQGKISSIDSLPDERTAIKVNFPYINDQTIYITKREKLICVSSDPNKPVTFQLELFPDKEISIKGTTWSGPVMSGPAAGQYAYPDLSSISFLANKNVTVYYRNGQPVPAQPTPQSPAPGVLEVAYRQYGAMVFMSGYKEDGILLMDYFGVLLPSGDKMMVHSGAQGARLPNYLQTIAWYGPIGATPIIIKK